MSTPLSQSALAAIFTEARTFSAWQPKPVNDELLRQIYQLASLGPTSANSSPMRVVFVKSPQGKARLQPALDKGNLEKTLSAPVTAIVAQDTRFYELMPQLWPHNPQFGEIFKNPEKQEFVKTHIMRNATLGGAYLIIAARALGLDCGPMSGFDNAKVDAEFFPDGRWKSNFLVNLGFGDPANLRPRNPRLNFEEACRII